MRYFAELFVFPSFYESFGLVSLEAMACGCPVVVSRTGGAPEAAGDAAVYVDPLNVEEIAASILRVLTSPSLRRCLIEKGFETLAEDRSFSPKMQDKFRAVLRKDDLDDGFPW